jgi:toxin ParE1/3/4
MRAVRLSPRARRDLQDIWTYSADRWGPERADAYLRRMDEAITRAARDPQHGRACDPVGRGYRKWAVGSHMLFYKDDDKTIIVIRVLHQSMDFERHL